MRLDGELRLAAGPDSRRLDAERCSLAAIEVARPQEAKSFELRAALSLRDRWRR